MNSNMVTLLLIVLLSISTYIEATKESKITEKVNLYPARLNNNQLDFNEKAQHIYITIYYYTKAANELLANAFEVSTDYTINPTQELYSQFKLLTYRLGDVLPSNGINKNESFHKLYQSLYFYSSCTLLLFLLGVTVSASTSGFWLFAIVFVLIKPENVRSVTTNQPTNAPTPFCVMLNVTVDANHTVNTTEFNGLYMYAWNAGNYPMWETAGGAGIIDYYGGNRWKIWGRSLLNELSHQSTAYFPPIGDANSEWEYSHTPFDVFHVLIECIESYAPTILPSHYPTAIPSISPTIQTTSPSNDPTKAPTSLCLSLYVTVIDANSKFDDNAFNGLYTLSDSKLIFDRHVWEAEADTDDQSVQYFAGSYWIIKGIGDINILSTYSKNYFPPINDTNGEWYH
eukprot:64897_1